MIKEYDVIIVGGGPAGGQCARKLSEKGKKVLLVEKFASFNENNFSTAGMTLEPLEEFNLPESVIGSYWSNIEIQVTKGNYIWKGDAPKGVILDFRKLRQYLADKTLANGSDVLMGHKYIKKEYLEDKVITSFQNIISKEVIKFQSKLVVDATGPLRKVMYENRKDEPELYVASAMEYLVKVKPEVYNKFRETFKIFLGYKWAPNGYSWVCAMEENVLKVGSGKLYIQDETEANINSKILIEKILSEYLYLTEDDYELLDTHGGILRYSPSLKDTFYKNKVVAIGDAISTINPLGGEGIRFAMRSADEATKYILEYLQTGKENFNTYRKKWRSKYLFTWRLSEFACRRMYSKYTDDQIGDRMKYYHKVTDIDKLINTLFYFNFFEMYQRVFMVYINLFKDKIKKTFKFKSKNKIKKK